MKKLLLCLTAFCTIFLLTGCTSEKVSLSLNLKELEGKIDGLQTEEFARVSAVELIQQKAEFVVDVWVYETVGLNDELIDTNDSSILENEATKDIYYIVKPLEGKKEDVKKAIEDHIKGKEFKFEEIDGYLVYVATKENNDIINEIKNCKAPVFSALMKVEKEMLESQFDIKENMLEEYLIKMPMMITSSNTYIIVKPASGQTDAVKAKLDTYMTNLEEQWKTYLPDQYELVKNRKVEEYGDYLIYIVSNDNEKVFEEIKANNQK